MNNPLLEPEREAPSEPQVEKKVADMFARPEKIRGDRELSLEDQDPAKRKQIIERIKKKKDFFNTDVVCGPG